MSKLLLYSDIHYQNSWCYGWWNDFQVWCRSRLLFVHRLSLGILCDFKWMRKRC